MPLPLLSKSAEISTLIADARNARNMASNGISATNAGPVSANAILDLCQRLNTTKVNVLVPALTSPGLMVALAQELRLADAAAATAAVQSLIDAITNTIDWVVTNFPASGGYLQKDTLNADGSVSVRQFTTVQTAGLRTQLALLVLATGG